MRQKYLLWLITIILFQVASSQTEKLSINNIPDSLLNGSNAVIREQKITQEIKDLDKLIISKEIIITVLNPSGDSEINTYEIYDDDNKLKNQELIIYNQDGEEINKLKHKDFLDRSFVVGSTFYTDSRVSYYEFTPREYPYTIKYSSEIQSKSTIFLIPWRPIPTYEVAVQKSMFTIINENNLPYRMKKANLEGIIIEENISQNSINYTANNLLALKKEDFAPAFNNIAPQIKVALNKFALVGVEGEATDWQSLGKWQYQYLLEHDYQINQKSINELEKLTANLPSKKEKIKAIYKYVQDNTRYISIQLGIGGWKPMSAEEVDQLGYGDCKALTNYTKALLKTQGIDSNYTVIWAGKSQRSIDENFASMEGNHVILNVPIQGKEDVWLECTNQKIPFNYLGDFTDNRNALKITQNGGEVVRTKKYSSNENLKAINLKLDFNKDASFQGQLEMKSKGIIYGNSYPREFSSLKKNKLYYHSIFDNFINITINDIKFKNNKNQQIFEEEVDFVGDKFFKKAGERYIIPLGLIDLIDTSVKTENRLYPIEISRGYKISTTITFGLPEGYKIEALPDSIQFQNEFGNLSIIYNVSEKNNRKFLKVIQDFTLNEGFFKKDKIKELSNLLQLTGAANSHKAVIIKS